MDTVLHNYRQALRGLDGVIQHVGPDHLDGSSPCAPWTVRHLLGHVIDGQRQVLAMISGQGPQAPAQELQELAAAAGAAPREAWRSAHEATLDALARLDPALTVQTPGGPAPAAEVLRTATIEPLVHSWDLAVAVRVPLALDAAAVRETLAGVRHLGGQLAASGMFAAAEPVSAGMSEVEQLLALCGRRPHEGAGLLDATRA